MVTSRRNAMKQKDVEVSTESGMNRPHCAGFEILTVAVRYGLFGCDAL
jgi:hypothetical protein